MKTHSFSIPGYGQLWESQGGHFAGILQHPDGRLYALVVPAKGQAELGEHEWGQYGKKLEGADSLTDGAANTHRSTLQCHNECEQAIRKHRADRSAEITTL